MPPAQSKVRCDHRSERSRDRLEYASGGYAKVTTRGNGHMFQKTGEIISEIEIQPLKTYKVAVKGDSMFLDNGV